MNAEEHRWFEDFHAEHAHRVLRLCRLLLGDPDEAKDVAQDVLVKLLRERPVGMSPGSLERWLTRVTVNACRDRRRSGWWRWWRRAGLQLNGDEVPASDSPERMLLGAEIRRHVWAAFRRLSPRQQEVFALRYVHGLSTSEVATTLGMSEGSAKRHLFRAVRYLRGRLGGLR